MGENGPKGEKEREIFIFSLRERERETERQRKWWVKGKRDRHGALEHVCVKQRREEKI